MMRLTTLPNGLRVATRSMRSVETVAVGVYAAVGSRWETVERNGLAHLFEHMVFKGAGGRSSRELNERIEDVGGDLNASTDRELTAFYASLLAPDLPLGVSLLADLTRRPHFDSGQLELEKKVVLHELTEARETASDIVFDHLQQAAFPGQAMGRSILGSERSIAALTVDDLQDWLSNHYVADRLILVAAGKVEHARFEDLAEKHFGGVAAGAASAPEPARFIGGTRSERRKSDQAHLALALPAPAWGEPSAYASQLFADVLGSGCSSRLFQRLREEQGLAYSVSAGAQNFSDCGMLWAYVATRRADAAWAQAELESAIASATQDLSPGEVERARALAKAGMLMSLESCWGQASYVATRLLRERRLVEPAEIVARLDAVTLDEVRAAGAQMLAGPRALASVGAKLALAA